MINLTFEIENQILKRTDKLTIVKKSRNIIKSSFNFTGEIWENINRFVIFTDSWGEEIILHLGKSDLCSCTVPGKCLKGTFFKVSVYGGDLVTTNEITIQLADTGYHNHHHKHPHTPCGHDDGKDVFVDIFDRLDTKIDNILLVDDCLQLYCDDMLVDSVCLDNISVDETQILERITEIESLLDNKSDKNHRHVKTDIDDLEDYLSISEFNQVILDELDE